MPRCPACHKHQRARQDTVCRACRRFIATYIESGTIPRRPVPMIADVLLVVLELGVTQDQAVLMLGGTP